jgi:uncharacterized membrane protein
MKKALWMGIVVLALLVGYIPIHYLINGVSQGYLELKSNELLRNQLWWSFLYTHIVSGGIAILIGWVQFSKSLQQKRLHWHRNIGKLYLVTALFCAISGFFIGFYATGGWVAKLGFIVVSCIYFYTTLQGYLAVRKKQITRHQQLMTYSYALCLSAVSLRLAVPFSYLFTDDYVFSYTIIAWAAWIPNLLIAYWVNKNNEAKTASQSPKKTYHLTSKGA